MKKGGTAPRREVQAEPGGMTMMDREQVRDLFSAYREGELPPDQVRALEAFLERDEETREDYERFCRTLDTLALLRQQPKPAPENFVEKLQKRIRRRSGGKLFGSRRGAVIPRVPYELFSLILILILLAVYLLTVPVMRITPVPGPEGGTEGSEQQSQPQPGER